MDLGSLPASRIRVEACLARVWNGRGRGVRAGRHECLGARRLGAHACVVRVPPGHNRTKKKTDRIASSPSQNPKRAISLIPFHSRLSNEQSVRAKAAVEFYGPNRATFLVRPG